MLYIRKFLLHFFRMADRLPFRQSPAVYYSYSVAALQVRPAADMAVVAAAVALDAILTSGECRR